MQVAPDQAHLDGVLALDQPVHGVVEAVFVDVGEAEDRGEGIGPGGGLETASGGELGAGVSETGDDQSHHQIALGTGRPQAAVQADLAKRAKKGSNVAVEGAEMFPLFMQIWYFTDADVSVLIRISAKE